MSRWRSVVGALLVVATAGVAAAQDTPCERWNRTALNAGLQRHLMTLQVNQLDGLQFGKKCLLGKLAELVHWANRTCTAGNPAERAYTRAFEREARRLCP